MPRIGEDPLDLQLLVIRTILLPVGGLVFESGVRSAENRTALFDFRSVIRVAPVGAPVGWHPWGVIRVAPYPQHPTRSTVRFPVGDSGGTARGTLTGHPNRGVIRVAP